MEAAEERKRLEAERVRQSRAEESRWLRESIGKNFGCPECAMPFYNRETCEQHIRDEHFVQYRKDTVTEEDEPNEAEMRKTVDISQVRFENISQVPLDENIEDKTLSCPECRKEFDVELYLENHIREEHIILRNFGERENNVNNVDEVVDGQHPVEEEYQISEERRDENITAVGDSVGESDESEVRNLDQEKGRSGIKDGQTRDGSSVEGNENLDDGKSKEYQKNIASVEDEGKKGEEDGKEDVSVDENGIETQNQEIEETQKTDVTEGGTLGDRDLNEQ